MCITIQYHGRIKRSETCFNPPQYFTCLSKFSDYRLHYWISVHIYIISWTNFVEYSPLKCIPCC